MRRNLQDLAAQRFDVLVVGGGIFGLAAAREAASRGLSTALLEKGDFGGATSANSLKLIHGGLRYLQHADIGRLRQSVRERLAFMQTAPHLVHPLPFLVPTYGHAMKGKEAMAAAFFLYRILAWDRNRTGDPEKEIPPGRLVSAAECLRLFPGFRREGLTGGAVFHDGQVHNLERLTLGVARAAAAAGAVLANYAAVTGFLTLGRRVTGVRARDLLGGGEFEVEASLVINAAGPWCDSLVAPLTGRERASGYLLAKAVNIVVRRPLSATHAVGVECRAERSDSLVARGGRLFFITPWRGASLVGTTYHTYRGDLDVLRVNEADIMELVDGVNAAWPGAALRREEVVFHHVGCVPITAETGPSGANLAKADRIIDHGDEDGIEGLVSMVGVKYTTARDVARRAVELAAARLGRPLSPGRTAEAPLPGGDIPRFADFLREQVTRAPGGLPEQTVRRLVYNYGSELGAITRCGEEHPGWLRPLPGSSGILRAEVRHGVREEMAVRLSDVVLRRTELGTMGHPGAACLEECAAIMADELGWDDARRAREMEEAAAAFTVAP